MTSSSSDIVFEPDARVNELITPLLNSVSELSGCNPQSVARVESALDVLQSEVSLLVREHHGMADDLLRVYEQLCMVFDVTCKLLTLSDEREVLKLIVESLRGSYPNVVFATAHERGEADSEFEIRGDVTSLPPWITESVARVRRDRRVEVANCGKVIARGADGAELFREECVAAPVFAGDAFVCALILWQRSNADSLNRFESGEMLLFDSLTSFCGDAIRNFRMVDTLRETSVATVRTLVNAVDQKDPYTSGHSNRVGYYSMLLAGELGLGADDLRTLEWSALLHDIGKIGIRDEVLKKAGRLTAEEFEHIKEHPARGYAIVRENPYMRDSLDGVLHHHERYDGKGYPEGLEGENIPLQARIIQIADIFDALTTNRSYRGAYHWRKALDILKEESGTVVDPKLSEAFIRLMERCYDRNPAAFDVLGKVNACPNLIEDAPCIATDQEGKVSP